MNESAPASNRVEQPETSVRVESLEKRFGDFLAVDRVTFSVRRGEIFGFLGSNGAGKTTTIRMLCGLLRPSSGGAWVGGVDVVTRPEEVKQIIGYMSQKFSLYDELTVEENMNFFGGVYGLRGSRLRKRRREVQEMLGLEEQREKLTSLLAGGWKQRLALGCAILHEPPILFLDEPTSGVDPLARRNFWDLIYQLSRTGHTIFVTTHYMDEAEYCHRLALMDAGQLVALDRPEGLRRLLADATLLNWEGSPLMDALRIAQAEPLVQEAAVFGSGLHLRVREAERAMGALRQRFRSGGIEVVRLEPIEPSIEDVFVEMVRRRERKS